MTVLATDVSGTSGRLMLRALIEGKTTPEEMAELAKRKLRSKIPQLELALEGKIEDHHRFLLKLQLDRLERAEGDLAVLEEPFGDTAALALTGRFVIARTYPRPRSQLRDTLEHTHVDV
jgi:hypothetical protein